MAMSRACVGTWVLAAESNTLCEPMAMLPEVGVSSPATLRRVEVLPQPLGPSRVRNSPGCIASEMPWTEGFAAPG
jgi:hypothetical protein